MKSSVETLEGNKVKVVVEVEEEEFEKDLDAAFARLAKEVRLPGFRPGKAPRKVLEARIGQGYARDEAMRSALPVYYSEAVKEHEVDVIAPPEIDITAGQEDGPVTFDAVVEIRPSIEVSGYDAVEVELPKIEVDDEDVDGAVDRLRKQFSELETVERAADEGDHVVINIAAVHDGEPIPGMTTDDYVYEVGSGRIGIPEIDEQLKGASAGDDLDFAAAHPDDDEQAEIEFSISVNEVQEAVLPEPTDQFIQDNSEFETLDELRSDYRERMSKSRVVQAQTARRNKIAESVADLVDDEIVPEAMVDGELESRVQDMAMRLQAQGLNFEQYMQFSGQDQDTMMEELRGQAKTSAKLDLALRAIAEAENITVTDDELDDEFDQVAQQFERTVDEVRAEFVEAGQIPAVRSDLMKSKTLDWLIEQAKLIDEDGHSVSPDALELADDLSADEVETDEDGATDEAASAESADSGEAASEETPSEEDEQ